MSAWKAGKVRYFCEKKGRGIIICEDGKMWQVHYSAIDSLKNWKNLKEDSKVKFKPLLNEFYNIAQTVKEVS